MGDIFAIPMACNAPMSTPASIVVVTLREVDALRVAHFAGEEDFLEESLAIASIARVGLARQFLGVQPKRRRGGSREKLIVVVGAEPGQRATGVAGERGETHAAYGRGAVEMSTSAEPAVVGAHMLRLGGAGREKDNVLEVDEPLGSTRVQERR